MLSCDMQTPSDVFIGCQNHGPYVSTGDDGKTPLMTACVEGCELCVQLLLEYKCDVNARDIRGQTALMFASSNGSVACIQLLKKYTRNINIRRLDGRTSLMLACYRGHKGCVEELLQTSCDIDARDNSGCSALMFATMGGHEECLQLLIDHKCDVRARRRDRKDALMLASQFGHTSCVRLLLGKGCDASATDHTGLTSLMLSSRSGFTDCVKLLLEYRCGINAQDMCGQTALMHACVAGHASCVGILLQHGCDLHAVNFNGMTALMLTSKVGHDECAQLLVEKRQGEHHDMSPHDEQILNVQSLMTSVNHVNMKSTDGRNAISYCSEMGHLEVVKTLVKAAAFVNNIDTNGLTPLMYAKKGNHREVELVLKKAARDSKTNLQQTVPVKSGSSTWEYKVTPSTNPTLVGRGRAWWKALRDKLSSKDNGNKCSAPRDGTDLEDATQARQLGCWPPISVSSGASVQTQTHEENPETGETTQEANNDTSAGSVHSTQKHCCPFCQCCLLEEASKEETMSDSQYYASVLQNAFAWREKQKRRSEEASRAAAANLFEETGEEINVEPASVSQTCPAVIFVNIQKHYTANNCENVAIGGSSINYNTPQSEEDDASSFGDGCGDVSSDTTSSSSS